MTRQRQSDTCYCLVSFYLLQICSVAGDHRVGIYAKEKLQAGQELFYDYQYPPGVAPPWARAENDKEKDGGKATRNKKRA